MVKQAQASGFMSRGPSAQAVAINANELLEEKRNEPDRDQLSLSGIFGAVNSTFCAARASMPSLLPMPDFGEVPIKSVAKEAVLKIRDAAQGVKLNGEDGAQVVVALWTVILRQVASARLTEADLMAAVGGVSAEVAVSLCLTTQPTSAAEWGARLSQRYLSPANAGQLS